jgi:hypothetical protein
MAFINCRMIEIFKTNVQKRAQSKMLLSMLSDTFPSFKINFDLADCDKILRVQGENIEPIRIMTLVKENGFESEVLE